LRVLQEKVIYHVGGSTPILIDVRFLTASNQDLQTSIAKGDFRQAPFFPLNRILAWVPPLRERKEDILYLAQRFLYLTKHGTAQERGRFSKSVQQDPAGLRMAGQCPPASLDHSPGGVLADDEITEAHLDVSRGLRSTPSPEGQESPWDNRPLKEIVQQMTTTVERHVFVQVLHITNGNKAEAAGY